MNYVRFVVFANFSNENGRLITASGEGSEALRIIVFLVLNN